MKSYHTEIEINANVATVWRELTNFASYPDWNPIVGKLVGELKVGQKIATYIIPLKNTFYPEVLAFTPNKELVWQGAVGARFLLAGKHYYQLEAIGENKTKLLHGESFTGLISWFMPNSILVKMKQSFEKHNEILKNRVEHEK